MKILFHGFIVVLGAAVTAALTTLIYHKLLVGKPSLENIRYQDFVSLSLTALGLMLTVLGFFVAAASIIGWTTIESKLREHSIQYFTKQLSKDGELRAEFEKLITEIAYEGIKQLRPNGEEEGEDTYND